MRIHIVAHNAEKVLQSESEYAAVPERPLSQQLLRLGFAGLLLESSDSPSASVSRRGHDVAILLRGIGGLNPHEDKIRDASVNRSIEIHDLVVIRLLGIRIDGQDDHRVRRVGPLHESEMSAGEHDGGRGVASLGLKDQRERSLDLSLDSRLLRGAGGDRDIRLKRSLRDQGERTLHHGNTIPVAIAQHLEKLLRSGIVG